MRYYIVAGEASGDLHASNLMKALKERDPGAVFRFWGGDLMSAAGGELVTHYKDMAFMGFWEVFKNLPAVIGNIRRCKRDIAAFNPDALVLVDYPGFNLRIAEFAKKRGITTVYYISPQVWAWKKGRIRKIRRDVDEMMVILPFEKDFYSKNGMNVHYVGHPLLDAVDKNIASAPETVSFRKSNGLSDKDIIALLPGSRRQEVEAILPRMLEVVGDFPQYQFVVSTVPWLKPDLYENLMRGHDVRPVCGGTYALLSNSKAAIVASGTATLETALIGTPQVVCYAGSELSYIIAKHLVSGISYISLVNLIMDKGVVTELIQHDLNRERLRAELEAITADKSNIAAMKDDYGKLRAILGGGSASGKAASIVAGAAAGRTSRTKT